MRQAVGRSVAYVCTQNSHTWLMEPQAPTLQPKPLLRPRTHPPERPGAWAERSCSSVLGPGPRRLPSPSQRTRGSAHSLLGVEERRHPDTWRVAGTASGLTLILGLQSARSLLAWRQLEAGSQMEAGQGPAQSGCPGSGDPSVVISPLPKDVIGRHFMVVGRPHAGSLTCGVEALRIRKPKRPPAACPPSLWPRQQRTAAWLWGSGGAQPPRLRPVRFSARSLQPLPAGRRQGSTTDHRRNHVLAQLCRLGSGHLCRSGLTQASEPGVQHGPELLSGPVTRESPSGSGSLEPPAAAGCVLAPGLCSLSLPLS